MIRAIPAVNRRRFDTADYTDPDADFYDEGGTTVETEVPLPLSRRKIRRMPIVVDGRRLAELVRPTPANEVRPRRMTELLLDERARENRTRTRRWCVLLAIASLVAFAAGTHFHDAPFVHATVALFPR